MDFVKGETSALIAQCLDVLSLMQKASERKAVTTIIQCPSCATKYRLKFEISDGQQVRCPSCKTVWRFQSPAFAPEAKAAPQMAAVDDDRHHYQDRSDNPRNLSESLAAHTQRTASSDNWSSKEAASQYHEAPWMQNREADFGDRQDDNENDERDQNRRNADGLSDEGQRPSGIQRSDLDSRSYYEGGGEREEVSDNTGASVGYREYNYEDPRIAREASEPPETAEGEETVSGDQNNWAAQLAEAINRTGHVQRGHGQSLSDEAQDTEYDGEQDAQDTGPLAGDRRFAEQGANGEWPEDAERLGAAERLDAFWRGGGEPDKAEPSDAASEDSLTQAGFPSENRTSPTLAMVAAWGLYLTFVGGFVFAALTFRDTIAHAMPGAAHYYAMLGLPVATYPLSFENVTYEWSERDGKPVLVVKGEVVNQTDVSITVPLLHITVRDDRAIDVASTVAVVVKEPLAGQARANFLLEFSSPPKQISEVELRFRT